MYLNLRLVTYYPTQVPLERFGMELQDHLDKIKNQMGAIVGMMSSLLTFPAQAVLPQCLIDVGSAFSVLATVMIGERGTFCGSWINGL